MRSDAKGRRAGSTSNRAPRHALLLALALLVVGAFATSASAATLLEIDRFPGEKGVAAGQFESPRGIAINRTGAGAADAGDFYVVDKSNQRIQQFDKDGNFIRLWGKDVDSAAGTGFEICEVEANCKKGLTGAEAGALNFPGGIVIDPDTGNLYVTDQNNRRIAVYGPAGTFQGAFGWAVNKTVPAEELQFCTAATECQAAKSTAPANSKAGAFASINRGAIALDPTNGNLWVGDGTTHRINEFNLALNGSEEVIGATFVRALGWNVNAAAPAEELQECTTATDCKAGTQGPGDGQIIDPWSIAIDLDGGVYVASESNTCTAALPCRIIKFDADGSYSEAFGPDSGGATTCQTNWVSGSIGENGTYWIAFDPQTQHLFAATKSSSNSQRICEFDGDGALAASSPLTPLAADAATSQPVFDFDGNGRLYLSTRLASESEWPVLVFGYVPAAGAVLEDPTEIEATSARLNGQVSVPKPGGQGFDVAYRFEYSPDNGLTWLRAPKVGDASVGTTVPGTYEVQQQVTGLLANTTYRVRLVTTTSFVTTSAERTFNTGVTVPGFSEVRARDASRDSVTLEAKIDPRGLPTTYRVEWGPTGSYGHVTPVGFEPFVGSGHEATRVVAHLTGLSAASRYHYRVVATNAAGQAATADRLAETLNGCGLPDGRCLEMVSPRDPGPVALPGEQLAGYEMPFQAADSGGLLAYEAELGYPGMTTIGGEVLYRAARGLSGWESTQYTPPLVGQTQGNALRSKVLGLSANLDCGVVASSMPLTSDPVSRLIVEAGGGNLYRRGADGQYTLITDRPPEALTPALMDNAFALIGMSDDCQRVVFRTRYDYPGIQGAGEWRLYEWDHGVLRNVGWVPDGLGGEVVAEAFGGTKEQGVTGNAYNAVSDDGSRAFFSATRVGADNPGEVGKWGVFARIDGTSTLDVSSSQTSIPAGDAVYQAATPDGSRVYFTANAGLTEDTSSTGRDLYECHIVESAGGEPECDLTDLSVNHDAGGAEAGGSTGQEIGAVVGLADDASHVYFVARGQLVEGEGLSFAENQAAGRFSLYDYDRDSEEVGFVATVGAGELDGITTGRMGNYTSRVSDDGRYLAFESSVNATAYESQGRFMAYLYDADDDVEPIVCISCRQDGEPSVIPGAVGNHPLAAVERNLAYLPQSLVVRHGEPVVFFRSVDRLAAGAIAGERNLYEWAHDQVFHIASDLPGATSETGGTLFFAGASSDGSDLYFVDAAALNWENPEGRRSVWTARVGGGFAPPASPVSCSPTSEGSCQGPAAQSTVAPGAGSASFNGAGNVKEKTKPKAKKRKAKKHKKKHAKKHRKAHKKKGKGAKKKSKRANGNRRAGK